MLLAENLDLPPKTAATQVYGFIARRGGGKSYAASKLVELLVLAGYQVVIVDQVGNWGPGLRRSADGKGPGLPIPVFGGEHPDIPVDASMGEHIGRLVIERSVSCVLDVSSFSQREMKTFVTGFAEAFYAAAKNKKAPRMLVLEEAQEVAPQNIGHGDERMFGAIRRIVRLGRNYGLGAMLISQRPQSISKEVLNQVEALFIGQLSGSHERKAIEAWCDAHDGDKSWLKELPRLQPGEFFFRSPQWLKAYERVRILPKQTYDASATPENDDEDFEGFPPTISLADVEGLRAALESLAAPSGKSAKGRVGSRGAKDIEVSAPVDSAELVQLREENARLSELADERGRQLNSVSAAVVAQRDEVRELLRSAFAVLARDAVGDSLVGMQQRHPEIIVGTKGTGLATASAVPSFRTRQEMEAAGLGEFWPYATDEAPPARPLTVIPVTREVAPLPPKAKPSKGKAGGQGFSGRAEEMLQVVCEFYPVELTRRQVGLAMGISSTTGSFKNYVSELYTAGCIDKIGDRLLPTSKALGSAQFDQVPNTYAGRFNRLAKNLGGRENELLRLVASNQAGISRAKCGAAMGISHTTGSFKNYVSALFSNGLIDKVGDALKPSQWLLRGKHHA
jgi:hypothetical protein